MTSTSSGFGSNGSEWVATYYYVEGGNEDITENLVAGNWFTPLLDPGTYITIQVDLEPTVVPPGGGSKSFYVEAELASDPTKIDAACAAASLGYRPDLRIAIQNDFSDITVDDKYESTPSADQTRAQNVAPAPNVVTYYLQLENDSGVDSDKFTMTDNGPFAAGWTIKYFTITDTEISLPYTTWSIAAGGNMRMKVEISYDKELIGGGVTLDVDIKIQSYTGGAGVEDVCRASTTTVNYQPDVLIKVEGGGYSYDGPGTPYSSVPANQPLGAGVNNNQTVTYYYKIQNDGNSAINFTVTGNAQTDGNWTLAYYYDPNDDSPADTGDDVLIDPIAGWDTGSIGAGSYKIIYVTITPSAILAGGEQKVVPIWATNTLTTQSDSCQVTATVNIIYQVDGHIRKDPGGNYTDTNGGMDKFTPSDPIEDQTIIQNPDADSTVTYYIR
ncbi:MAG: hypothetical protein KAI63_06140, partial [Planctomycetes bacterium]|nr:hypothetical protein [Planctomycetota bacterium]